MKPPKPRTDWKTWPSIVLSVSSFVLSVFGFWYASLASADIKASLGTGLTFHFETGDSPPGPGWEPVGLMIVTTISYANNGAKVGEIKALNLELKDDDGTVWSFEPMKVVTDEQKTISLLGSPNRNWDQVVTSGFGSVVVAGRQTAAQSYLFRSEPKWSTNKVFGPHHRFRVTLLTLSSGEREFRVQDRATIVIDPQYVLMLPPGGTISIPFEELQQATARLHANP